MLGGVTLSLSSAAWAQQPPFPPVEGDEPQTVLVVAQRDQAETSFKADRSDTTTRSGADLRSVPQSVTVITSRVLESQQATSLQDALRNVSGIAFTESPQGLPTFSVRGFSETSTTTNGVTDRGATLTSVFGVERVEVLKGPQAILAGAGSLGGGVNVVTKKPQAQTIRNLTFQYGSHGDVTLAADLSGALSADNKLTYRLIASRARASDTTVGYDGRKDKFILPQLRWKDAATDLIVGLSYGEQHMPPPAYTFALRSGAILPRPAMLLSNQADGFDTTQKRVFYQLEQKLTSWLAFESRLQRALGDDLLHLYTPFGIQYGTGAAANVSLGTSPFFPGNNRTLSRTTSGDHYLRASFASGPIRHKLALGYSQVDTDSVQYQRGGNMLSIGLYPASGYAFANSEDSAATIQGIYTSRQKQQSFYLQDLLTWGDWNVQLNARHTRVDTGGNTNLPSSNYNQDLDPNRASKTTPGVGVVYNLTPDAALYASVANGFAAQISNLCGGGVPPAQTTHNKEVGAKFGLLDNKLSLTSSVFQLEQNNLLQYINATRCYVPRDAKQTRGAELDLQGQLAPGWNAIANYTYNLYRDLGAQGTLFPGLPKHKFSLWTTYDFQNAALKGWGVGAGLNAASQTIGSRSAATQFTLPGQARIDASLFYRKDRWDLTLGVKNLGDRLLYGVSTSNSYIPVLEGRSYLLTVRHSFQ